jgi:hypothetical protein
MKQPYSYAQPARNASELLIKNKKNDMNYYRYVIPFFATLGFLAVSILIIFLNVYTFFKVSK